MGANKYKRQICFLLLFFLCILIFSFKAEAQLLELRTENGISYAGDGWLVDHDGLKLAYFSGSPEEIGQQQALFLIEPGGRQLEEVFRKLQQEMVADNRLAAAFQNLYSKYKLLPAFKRHIPDEYLSELRGMALALSGGQSDNYDEFLLSNAAQDLGMVMGCAIFSAWGEMTESGELLVGRNLDHTGYAEFAKYQYLAFYDPEQGNKFVSLNYPSFVGVMQGMNDKGLVVAMTYSMVKSSENSIDGLPYMIMLRQLLQYADNLEEAISIIKETPRTVGLNILLASAVDGRAVVVESSASRLFVREAADYIYTSNSFHSDYMKKYQSDGWMSSHLRDMRFEELREIYRGELNYKTPVKIMRDKYAPGSSAHRGYVSGIQNEGTMASLVFRPEHLQLFVNKRAETPVPEGEYYGFDCKELWESKQAIKPFEIIPEAPDTEYTRQWLTVREAELAHNKGDNERVKELMEPVVTAEPESETPLLLLGISYLRSGESDKGIELLERLVNLPKIAQPYHLLEAYFWLGSTYDIVKEDRQQAVEYYKKARDLDIPDMYGENDMLLKLIKAGIENPLVLEDGRIIAK